jgi:uncharacterized protein DUF2848
MLELNDERGAPVRLDPVAFIIAGYTGRDPESVEWYDMPPGLLTTAESIEVATSQTCGEVEPVLIGNDGRIYLGIGSDHAARDVEREDVERSRRACPKPLGRSLLRVGVFDEAFDALQLESWVDGEAYQSGTVSQIIPLQTLLSGFRSRRSSPSFVLYCGTVPLLTDGFRYGEKFSARISGAKLPAPLTLDYTTVVEK